MSDPVTRQAEKWLKDIKREFSISFHKLGPSQVPALRVRISDHPPNPSDDPFQKEQTCTRPVFAELQRLVLNPANLTVYIDDGGRHPWFDLAFTGESGALTFRVIAVHPVRELKSSA
ncbi:MAG TPA: hypothetical protein VMU11_04225 [Verrucomicrobiae bacterium]|nr:hypothetical protein [Verrucomicrobiae bacterium]